MYNSSSKHAVTVFSEKPKPFVVLIVFCQESVNEKVFNIIPINPDGTPLTHLQKQESDSENLELPFIESMIEMWEIWSCQTFSGDFIFSRSSTWRSIALKKLMGPVNEERNHLHAECLTARHSI